MKTEILKDGDRVDSLANGDFFIAEYRGLGDRLFVYSRREIYKLTDAGMERGYVEIISPHKISNIRRITKMVLHHA